MPRVMIPKAPIKSLSDLIFGLALSIGTISLIAGVPRTTLDVATDIVQFGFSFLILIFVWMSYTSVMSVLPLEDETTIVLNLLLLFLVSIEPYLFWLNATYASDVLKGAVATSLLNSASMFYAVNMAGLMLILALFTHQLTSEEKRLVPREVSRRYRHVRNTLLVSAGIFALTVLPIFWSVSIMGTPIRFYVWFLPLTVSWLRRISMVIR
ncbi:MAG: TMEM175 family protein [Candidatus Bathyarchaeia archaeon]